MIEAGPGWVLLPCGMAGVQTVGGAPRTRWGPGAIAQRKEGRQAVSVACVPAAP